jgi:hypothetical protein
MADHQEKSPKILPGRLIGVELFLGFFICLILLGYSTILSFVLAAIAGVTGGILWHWWYDQDQTIHQAAPKTQTFLLTRPKKLDIKEAQERRKLLEKKGSQGSLGLKEFFSRRRN